VLSASLQRFSKRRSQMRWRHSIEGFAQQQQT
jgi:hypothetical protein